MLKMSLSDKQAEVMDALAPVWSRVSARCANEVGKTSRMICGLILWHGAMFPRSTSVSTSGSWLQVTKQLVPHLHRYKERFPKWDFKATEITGHDGRAVWTGFSTKEEGRAEGFHGGIEDPLMVLADEAKSISDAIFTAIEDRVNPQRYGLFSSPGYAEGEFYRSHTVNSKLYRTFKITAFECPHIEPHTIQRRIDKWGRDHPLVKSAIDADFMEFIQDAIFSLADWDSCIENAPQIVPGERHAFIDFSGLGGAETVLGMRLGNEVWREDSWSMLPEMATVGRLVTGLSKLKREYGLRPEEVEGDADGLGGPMIGRLEELGWPIGRFHGGEAPNSPDYFNLVSEVWFTGADRMRRNEIVIRDWKDEDLRGQLINRKNVPHSSGKLKIESKKDMVKRNLPSPDRADALLGSMRQGVGGGRRNIIRRDPLDVLEDTMSVTEDLIGGINAGL